MRRYRDCFFLSLVGLLASSLSAFAVPNGQSAPVSDVSSMTITGSGSNVPRTAAVRAADEINGLDYSSFSSAVAQASSTNKVLRLPPGTYPYSSATTLTISVPVIFEPGAVLSCSGSNVTFNGLVSATRTQIFASGCTPSFWGNKRESQVFPEWWGAVGDSACTAGNGTDSTAGIANAIASGAAQVSLAGAAAYRVSTIPTTRSNLSLLGTDRGSTLICQDDSTGALDAIFFSGNAGQNTIKDINFSRIQPGIGSVASALVIAGGAGYAVNDTITLAGGTFTTAAVLKVTSVSSGAITGLSVQTAGAYTQAAPPTATPTVFPAVPQASTSGSGSGATVKLLWQGPSLLRLQDVYFTTVEHNTFSGNAWDNIRISGLSYSPSQVYIERNQIFSANHDNIFIYGPSGYAPGDIFIEDHNYISGAQYAGIEVRSDGGSIGGIFVTQNGIYNDKYGQFWDAGTGSIGSSKIRANDIDTNAAGDFYFGLGESQYQQNWHSDIGPFVCTNCANIQAEGNLFTTTSVAAIFNGGGSVHFDSNNYTGGTGAVQINPYNGTQAAQITFASSNWSYGSGYFLTTTGAPTQITVGVQLTSSSQGVINPTSSINNLTIIGPSSPTNNSNNPMSGILYGTGNVVGGAYSAAGGNGNTIYAYGATAFGQNNTASSSFSNVFGYLASDDNVVGSTCFASGATTGSAGAQQVCQHVLRARSTSTSPVRLTSDGNAASAYNCLNLPDTSHAQFMIMVSGFSGGGDGTADWVSSGPNTLTRYAGAASITYGGSYSTSTAPAQTTGAGTGARLQLSADTTNGCLNVTITPPDSNTWDWEAAIIRLKMQ